MVKTELEIQWMINEIEGLEPDLDDHMKGYVAALKWVLRKTTLSQEIWRAIPKEKSK